jgi:hypothetical protein
MGQITIPCRPGEISDGYHTFDELYAHRSALYIAFLKGRPRDSWMSKRHCDNSIWDGWFVAGTTLSTGSITYHLKMEYWDCLKAAHVLVLDSAPKWDGHTSNDVYERIIEYVKKH